MTTENLQALIDAADIEKLRSSLETVSIASDVIESLKQYDIKDHNIFDKSELGRPDKRIYNEKGELTKTIPVARIPLSLQKKIVMTSAAFLGVPEMSYTAKNDLEEDFAAIIYKVLEDNKFDYKFNTCVKKTKSERQSAILIYTQELKEADDYWKGAPIQSDTKYKLRFKILAQSLGDILYPVFDGFGDMIAFGRYYEATEMKDGKEVIIKHFDLYTNDRFYFSVKEDDWITKDYPNLIGKIPVIYFSQPATDWDDVQALIERLETKISNHADTNDYYDSPIVKAKGNVEGFSDKGESGKVLQMDEGADAEYMTYDSLPQSMKMELDNLIMFIHSLSHTPDISFENLKNLGYFSTIALKVMFMDAHLKAYDSEEIFGEGVQRLYNYLKKAVTIIAPGFKPAISLQLKPKFTYFLPQNVADEVDILIKAREAGMISNKSMIEQSPLVQDAENEMKQIKKEKDASIVIPPVNPLIPPTE